LDKQTQELMFSSEFFDWEAPDELFEELNKEFNFDIDVCATKENTKCKNFISPEQNMLESYWYKIAWMNPPYNKPEKPCKKSCKKKKCDKREYHINKYIPGQIDFVARVYYMALCGITTVCLLPARTDTDIFHTYIWDNNKKCFKNGIEVRFLKGRLKFKGAKNPAPFPSMIVIFRPPVK